MKRIALLLLLVVCISCVGCAKMHNQENEYSESQENNRQETDYVTLYRNSVVERHLYLLEAENPIYDDKDRHINGIICDMCGKHTDFTRKDCVDLAQAQLVTKNMASLDVYDLIGNPHFSFTIPADDVPTTSNINVDMTRYNFWYYYVLSDGTLLQISYDDETRTRVCDVEILTGDAFMEKYPADAK